MFSKFNKHFNPFVKISSRGIKTSLKEKLSNSSLGYIFAGVGISGLAFLMYKNGKRRETHTRMLISSAPLVERDISLKRTRDTLMYFTGSIGITSLAVAGMLRSQRILAASNNLLPLLLTIPASIFCMWQMATTPDTPQNSAYRHLLYLGFNGCIAFSLVPIISFSELVVVRDAFLLTSGCFAGLGLVASNARDDAFLGMSGFLGAGLGAIAAVGLANIFLQSNALFNVWLYGGLALFLGLTLYDMKEVQNRARRSPYFDPMTQSLGVYLDFVNIFVRLLMILGNRKNNRK